MLSFSFLSNVRTDNSPLISILGSFVNVPMNFLPDSFTSASIFFAYFELKIFIDGNFVIESAPDSNSKCSSFRCESQEPATISIFGNLFFYI